jgi:hypothetical protein
MSCSPLQLQEPHVLELQAVFEHRCHRHDELGRFEGSEGKSSSQHLRSANGVSYRRTTAST